MSYDLYCYAPASSVPDATEAQALVELFNADEEAGITKNATSEAKEKIAAALMECNPRLERFQFDFGEIAKAAKISEQEARARYQHIELNPAEGDLAIQLTVHDDHVDITVPYWYKGSDADGVFSQLSDYLRVVRKTAGFFVYDPQTGAAFDPEQTSLIDHTDYDRVVKDLPKMVAESAASFKKPWWKFW
jgi:hypothetical protein